MSLRSSATTWLALIGLVTSVATIDAVHSPAEANDALEALKLQQSFRSPAAIQMAFNLAYGYGDDYEVDEPDLPKYAKAYAPPIVDASAISVRQAFEPGAFDLKKAHRPAEAFQAAFDLAYGREPVQTVDIKFPLESASHNRFNCDSDVHDTPVCDKATLSDEMTCLAKGVYYEARGESIEGKQAVAKVILNRVASPRYPASICKVVYQGANRRGCQFSWACKGVPAPPREPAAWRASVAVAAEVLSDPSVAPFDTKVVNFHADYVNPRWRMKRVAQIGTHLFYAPY